jgi:capsule biosynthesis phosphatase
VNEKNVVYVFDIDGTICTNTNGDYFFAEPLYDRIKRINDLYDRGNQIYFYTARGMGRYENNVSMAKDEMESMTREQLENWGVKFHELFLGKPAGDVYVDDKALRDSEFFSQKR